MNNELNIHEKGLLMKSIDTRIDRLQNLLDAVKNVNLYNETENEIKELINLYEKLFGKRD